MTRQLLTFGVTSFYAYNILQNVVTGKHQRELSLRNYAECLRILFLLQFRGGFAGWWSVPEEQHGDQDEGTGNGIPDKVHPMDVLTAAEPGVFVLAIHITNHPRQNHQ